MNVPCASRRSAGRESQRGATLLLGVIMLTLLVLHALASHTASTMQLRIAGNMQSRQDAQAAANLAIGQMISSGDFAGPQPASRVRTIEIDVDDDASNDYRVTVTATCAAAIPLRPQDLDPAIGDDLQCVAGTAFGGAALCTATHWNLQAIATTAAGAAATGEVADVNQGVVVRVDAGQARRLCPVT